MKLLLILSLIGIWKTSTCAIIKKVPGLGFIINSSVPRTYRTRTVDPNGSFDPDLSIQKLMDAEDRYHPIEIATNIYKRIEYHLINETLPPFVIKFSEDGHRILSMLNTTMVYDIPIINKKNTTYIPKREHIRRKKLFLYGPPTTIDPTDPALYWTYYLNNFEPDSEGKIVIGGWKKKEVITRGPKRPDFRLKGARKQLNEMDFWGIYANLLTPKPKIKWTPNIFGQDFNFDHEKIFDLPDENTVWILPATESWEDWVESKEKTQTRGMFIPKWLRGEGLDPKKRGKGGVYKFEGQEYKEWEVPVKYRSLAPEMLSKYYEQFDERGRKLSYNRTLPFRWGTNVPYGRTFTYRMDITNNDGSINKTVWKKNPGFVTRDDGQVILIRDMNSREKLQYLHQSTEHNFIEKLMNITHSDGSLNYSTIIQERKASVTWPTVWVNFTNDDGSLKNRLWKFIKPTTMRKYKTIPADEATETVRFTYPNGSLHRIFWKLIKQRTPMMDEYTTPKATQFVDDHLYRYSGLPAYKEFEIVTYADGGVNCTVKSVPRVYNKTAPDGSFMYSFLFVPRHLRENYSTTKDYKLITNRDGEVIKMITYRPKLFQLHTLNDGSFNYSEKVSNFDQLKDKYYTSMNTVNHTYSNGSLERTHFVTHELLSTPFVKRFYGYAKTKLINFTKQDGVPLGTFWKVLKNVGFYTGTGQTLMYTFTNARGQLAHSFWREIMKFTNLDHKIKENDTTEIHYVTRKDGYLYGSFKRRIKVFTTPPFRPYTGNLSTITGLYTYPNGTVYGSHWQVERLSATGGKNYVNVNAGQKTTGSFFRSSLYQKIQTTRYYRPGLDYVSRILYATDYYGNIKYSYNKLFSYPKRMTSSQSTYTGDRNTKILHFTDHHGSVYGSYWFFADRNFSTTPRSVKSFQYTTKKPEYFTYQGPRSTKIVNYTNANGQVYASFWLFVTDVNDVFNKTKTTLPPLVTPNKFYNAFYYDPNYVSTVIPPVTHSQYDMYKHITDMETDLPFSTFPPNTTFQTLMNNNDNTDTTIKEENNEDYVRLSDIDDTNKNVIDRKKRNVEILFDDELDTIKNNIKKKYSGGEIHNGKHISIKKKYFKRIQKRQVDSQNNDYVGINGFDQKEIDANNDADKSIEEEKEDSIDNILSNMKDDHDDVDNDMPELVEKIKKRIKRNNNVTETTTDDYTGGFIRKSRIKTISESLYEIRQQYNITFSSQTPTEKFKQRHKKRHENINDKLKNNNENILRYKRESQIRKFYRHYPDMINDHMKHLYENLTNNKDQIDKFKNKLNNTNDQEELLNKIMGDMNEDYGYVHKFNDIIHPNVFKEIKNNTNNEEEQLVANYDTQKLINKKIKPSDNDLKRRKRFVMTSDERDTLAAWNLYYNLTGNKEYMENLKQEWKKAGYNETSTHSHAIKTKREIKENILNRNKRCEPTRIHLKMRDFALRRFCNLTGRTNYTFNIPSNEEETTTPYIVTKKIKFKKTTSIGGRKKVNENEGSDDKDSVRRKKRYIDDEPHVNIRKKKSKTLSPELKEEIRKGKKEGKKLELWLEKFEHEEHILNRMDDHFEEYPGTPFYFQKTVRPPLTVYSNELYDTDEEEKDSKENLTLQECGFKPVNVSNELFWRVPGIETGEPPNLNTFEPFMPPRNKEGKFEDNWYQMLKDGRTFDYPVEVSTIRTAPSAVYYFKTSPNLEDLREFQEMYEDLPFMREELLKKVDGNRELLDPDKFGPTDDDDFLDKCKTVWRSGELFYEVATTIKNFKMSEEIKPFHPNTKINGDFEDLWYQIVEGKTYKRPVDLNKYYSIPSTTTPKWTPKPTRTIKDTEVNSEVLKEKMERYFKKMNIGEQENRKKRRKRYVDDQ